jgi:toxin-antitoxin system PIN domain toxin
VILVDTNLLVYAHVATFPQHEAARAWLDERLNGSARVGLPWPSLLGFVRLVSNPRVFERPALVLSAWRQVEEWLECQPVWIPLPTDQHRAILASLLTHVGNRANLVPDTDLAALALEHGLVLCSTDGDFARFPHLRWENPLQASP